MEVVSLARLAGHSDKGEGIREKGEASILGANP
jgi:hypothetical protein